MQPLNTDYPVGSGEAVRFPGKFDTSDTDSYNFEIDNNQRASLLRGTCNPGVKSIPGISPTAIPKTHVCNSGLEVLTVL